MAAPIVIIIMVVGLHLNERCPIYVVLTKYYNNLIVILSLAVMPTGRLLLTYGIIGFARVGANQ